nr:universal stress protein UspA [uncultured Pseudogulbenkiania sp.]
MDKPSPGKVLLALDVSPRSRAALELAAALAAARDVELAGLFIEDINLLHLAALPFTREIGQFSRAAPLAAPQLEHALRCEAEQARRLLADTATRRQLRWSFQLARGQIATELFARAAEPDLVVLGKSARMGTMPLWTLLCEAPPPLPPRRAARPRLVVLFDGSPGAARALALARDLAQSQDGELRVLIPADNEADFLRHANAAMALAPAIAGGCRRLLPGDSRALAAAVREENATSLVLDGSRSLRSGTGFAALLNDIDCPVILVS